MTQTVDFLILSGNYIPAEMVAEFGRLPPVFLPFGSGCVLQRQLLAANSQSQRIFLTLPDDYELAASERPLLEHANVTPIRTGAGKTLQQAALDAAEQIKPKGALCVLYGDTVIDLGEESSRQDIFATGTTNHYAIWAEYSTAESGRTQFRQGLTGAGRERSVVSGYFCFSDGAHFASCLSEAVDFIDALNRYTSHRNLQPIAATRWLDFGHLHTYFFSRQADLTARTFNSVQALNYSIRKTGEPARKIHAEAEWFSSVPGQLKPFLPQLYQPDLGGNPGYELEYLFLPLLSELFVFGRLPPQIWTAILESCANFLEICQQHKPGLGQVPDRFDTRFFRDVIVNKTLDRIETFAILRGISIDSEWKVNGRNMPSLRRTVEQLIGAIPPTQEKQICIWHGDFHFGNLFYDFRGGRIRAVDPRGMLSDGTITMYGDLRYDISKLAHSITGLYDYIITGRYQFRRIRDFEIELNFALSNEVKEVQNDFARLRIGEIVGGSAEIVAITALLFFSMLPLHSENAERQDALLANGFRISKLMEDI